MKVLLVFDPTVKVEGDRFDAECFDIIGAAEKDGFAVAVAGPEVTDRLRKAVTKGRHVGLEIWVAIGGRIFDIGDPSAEVLMILGGCLVDETQVVHDWFGKVEVAR